MHCMKDLWDHFERDVVPLLQRQQPCAKIVGLPSGHRNADGLESYIVRWEKNSVKLTLKWYEINVCNLCVHVH